jgi:hypothetical protein
MPSPNVDRGQYLRTLRYRMRVALVDFAEAERMVNLFAAYFTAMHDGNKFVGDVAFGDDPEAVSWISVRNSSRERARTYALAILAEEQLSYLESPIDVGEEPTVVTSRQNLYGLLAEPQR